MRFGRAIGTLAALIVLAGRAVKKSPPPGTAFYNGPALLRRLTLDQQRIWSFPRHAARLGTGWKPALGVIGVTAALIALDPLDTPWIQQAGFQQMRASRALNRILSGRNTALAIAAIPLSFCIAGLLRRDPYAAETALLAGEAIAGAEIVSTFMKDVDRRMRPSEVGPAGDFTATWFRTKNRNWDGFGSFPSGHSASSFAVATVFAERYATVRWAPRVAYGLAGIVALSRLNARAHYPSDVFFGAVLGHAVSHYVVLRRQP